MSLFDNIQDFVNGLNSGDYRYDEALMENMIHELENMINSLDETKSSVTENANKIQTNEYLVGETADRLHEAMTGTLSSRIGEIRDEAQIQLDNIKLELEQFREVMRKYPDYFS